MLTRDRTARPRVQRSQRESGEWGRAKLLAAVALSATLVLLLATGAGLWLWFQFLPVSVGLDSSTGVTTAAGSEAVAGGAATSLGSAAADQQARRDALAAAPMPSADASAALPAVLSSRDPGVILLPAAADEGPVGIPSGFPPTYEGALAQLAAIDVAVLNAVSIDHARQVINGWAQQGGPNAESWSAIKVLTSFHTTAGLSGGAASGAAVRATPMMGLVKATDGPGWAVVCVDFELDATITRTGRIAAADCQRMTWVPDHTSSGAGREPGRWMIAAGSEPADAPSIWPGTDAAINAGYRNLRQG